MKEYDTRRFVDSIKFIAKNVFLSYDAGRMENTLVIDLNIEDTVSQIMKEVEKFDNFDNDMLVVLKVGKHSIKLSREVEVVKKVKTKGYNISE